MKDPLVFSSETPMRKFVAYIDPEDKFAIEDKLSQINTLEQRTYAIPCDVDHCHRFEKDICI